MMPVKFLTDWFVPRVTTHSEVSVATALPSGHVCVERTKHSPVTVAPVSTPRLDAAAVDQLATGDTPTVICLIPRDSHYDWHAREKALAAGSSVQTMKELWTSLSEVDPRPFQNKDVAYARARMSQHSRVDAVQMVCEASMEVTRDGLEPVLVAIEYEYEFGEEALVRALKRHPAVDAVLNSNPNGKSTRAALDHAKQADVALFSLSELMGALNFDGSAFRDYRSPR